MLPLLTKTAKGNRKAQFFLFVFDCVTRVRDDSFCIVRVCNTAIASPLPPLLEGLLYSILYLFILFLGDGSSNRRDTTKEHHRCAEGPLSDGEGKQKHIEGKGEAKAVANLPVKAEEGDESNEQ